MNLELCDTRNLLETKLEDGYLYHWREYCFKSQTKVDKLFISVLGKRQYLAVWSGEDCTVLAPCRKCKKLLTRDGFLPNRGSPCKACHAALVRDWQAKHPEQMAMYNQRYKARHK